jgi:O-antigen/teichoic acid export membrane protein
MAWMLEVLPPIQKPSWTIVEKYLRECWPLLLTSLCITLYMNLDIAMLRWIAGNDAAGIYATAARLSSIWYFIPLVLATTLFPKLIEVHQNSPASYQRLLRWYFDVNATMSIACLIFALAVFPTLIHYLFGAQFANAISVFSIHIWAIPFVFLGVARGQHLTLESLHRFNLASTLLGLGANVILNLLLIPNFGPHGAAVSTFVSYALSAYLSSFLVSELRPIGWLQTESMVVGPWRVAREYLT